MSIKIKIYNQKGEAIGEEKLTDKIFNLKINDGLVHQAMVAQMANERQVIAHTKDRSEVRGGGKKPWRQKGTGRARAGSNRSPIWIGGGVTFGPTKDRNFKKKINRKMKQKAICMVLSDRAGEGNLVLLDQMRIEEFKTKKFNEILKNIEEKLFTAKKNKNAKEQKNENTKAQKRKSARNIKRSFLIINDRKDEKIRYSGRNLAGVKIINLENINILDLLKYQNLILTKESVNKLTEKYKK